MTAIRTFTVTASTTGRTSPAAVADQARPGWYRYKRDPGWIPGSPRYPAPPDPVAANSSAGGRAAARNSKAARAARVEAVRAALEADPGLTVSQAARLIGVTGKTARTYLAEIREQQGGGDA